jgi:hypothetical protein
MGPFFRRTTTRELVGPPGKRQFARFSPGPDGRVVIRDAPPSGFEGCRRETTVIARNTAFTYKGTPYDVTKIGQEFNVHYVLEGSVQRGGSRMRISVQLIDAESGHHLWAERFDKPVTDLFDMQDEIVARLANELGTALIAQTDDLRTFLRAHVERRTPPIRESPRMNPEARRGKGPWNGPFSR